MTKIRPPYKEMLKNGPFIGSVTTILNRFKNAGPLMYWAWEQGKEGKDFRETRDHAADIGTCAHAMVEANWRNEPFDAVPWASAVIEKALVAYEAYSEWARQTQLQVIEGEMPLVSETYRYGGTLDALMLNGKLALGDWKTSGGVYPEYLLQLAAYRQLWEENFPDRPITGGFHLLRFDKTYGDFEHRYFAELETAWKAFALMLSLYERMKVLEKRVK